MEDITTFLQAEFRKAERRRVLRNFGNWALAGCIVAGCLFGYWAVAG
jgi:hypothetical protein